MKTAKEVLRFIFIVLDFPIYPPNCNRGPILAAGCTLALQMSNRIIKTAQLYYGELHTPAVDSGMIQIQSAYGSGTHHARRVLEAFVVFSHLVIEFTSFKDSYLKDKIVLDLSVLPISDISILNDGSIPVGHEHVESIFIWC